jgi:hypothetical protein
MPGLTKTAEGPAAQFVRLGIGGALGTGRGGQIKCVSSNDLEGGGALGDIDGVGVGGVCSLAEGHRDSASGSMRQELVAL